MKKKSYIILKNIVDFILSLIAIIVLLPIFFIIAIIIKIESKGPVFFKQDRIAKNKKIFKIYKFRTMRSDTPSDTPTHLLKDPTIYITKIGATLRKTSLDELPQLINILKGEMSIIGPRPALWNQDDLIAKRDEYMANDIKPGLTGLAQISGRDELEIDVKAKIDGEYFEKMGLILDIKIFFKTVFNVLKQKDVTEGKK